jgi:hypothetical protein
MEQGTPHLPSPDGLHDWPTGTNPTGALGRRQAVRPILSALRIERLQQGQHGFVPALADEQTHRRHRHHRPRGRQRFRFDTQESLEEDWK